MIVDLMGRCDPADHFLRHLLEVERRHSASQCHPLTIVQDRDSRQITIPGPTEFSADAVSKDAVALCRVIPSAGMPAVDP